VSAATSEQLSGRWVAVSAATSLEQFSGRWVAVSAATSHGRFSGSPSRLPPLVVSPITVLSGLQKNCYATNLRHLQLQSFFHLCYPSTSQLVLSCDYNLEHTAFRINLNIVSDSNTFKFCVFNFCSPSTS
jgi:hypothetical protein